MRCAIDGKVMVNPVRLHLVVLQFKAVLLVQEVLSRYGHHFEKKTLEKWFGNCGSVTSSEPALFWDLLTPKLSRGVSDNAEATPDGGVSTRPGDEEKASHKLHSPVCEQT